MEKFQTTVYYISSIKMSSSTGRRVKEYGG